MTGTGFREPGDTVRFDFEVVRLRYSPLVRDRDLDSGSAGVTMLLRGSRVTTAVDPGGKLLGDQREIVGNGVSRQIRYKHG